MDIGGRVNRAHISQEALLLLDHVDLRRTTSEARDSSAQVGRQNLERAGGLLATIENFTNFIKTVTEKQRAYLSYFL